MDPWEQLSILYLHPIESPNEGNLPEYVVVDFPLYIGPEWSKGHKTVSYSPRCYLLHTCKQNTNSLQTFLFHLKQYVPIPVVKTACRHKCCQRSYIPLKLSYGRTVHTFQGQSAGPTEEGKPPNAVQRIIVDPGNKQFEGLNPGLFYTILSRITTIGTTENKHHDSAIFFSSSFNRDRVMNLCLKKDGTPYVKILHRQKWIRRIHKHQIDLTKTESYNKKIHTWSTTTNFTKDQLELFISTTHWRTNNGINF